MKKSKPKRKSNNANTVLAAATTPTISKKKRTQLYGLIHEDIMQARISIARLIDGTEVGRKVDDVLYKLHIDCPEKAVRLFERHGS